MKHIFIAKALVAVAFFASIFSAKSQVWFTPDSTFSVAAELPDSLMPEPHDGFDLMEETNFSTAEGPLSIPARMEIELELDDEIVPVQAEIGDTILLRVAEEVEVDGQVFFNENALAWGKIKHLASGKIYVAPFRAEAADGQFVSLTGRSLAVEYDLEEREELVRLEGELVGLTGY